MTSFENADLYESRLSSEGTQENDEQLPPNNSELSEDYNGV